MSISHGVYNGNFVPRTWSMVTLNQINVAIMISCADWIDDMLKKSCFQVLETFHSSEQYYMGSWHISLLIMCLSPISTLWLKTVCFVPIANRGRSSLYHITI